MNSNKQGMNSHEQSIQDPNQDPSNEGEDLHYPAFGWSVDLVMGEAAQTPK